MKIDGRARNRDVLEPHDRAQPRTLLPFLLFFGRRGRIRICAHIIYFCPYAYSGVERPDTS